MPFSPKKTPEISSRDGSTAACTTETEPSKVHVEGELAI